MQRLTDEEWSAQFRAFERSALHLELRDWYAVDEERERFARFLALGRRDHEAEADERGGWLTFIRESVQSGKRIRRARVVSEPVTDYIRFEWAGTDLTAEAGEEVRWLPRRLASGIALPGNDFWLFDDSTVVFNLFTGDGQWAGAEMTTDPGVARLCKAAFEAVWSAGIPHNEYKPA
jgi:hypothetical protein